MRAKRHGCEGLTVKYVGVRVRCRSVRVMCVCVRVMCVDARVMCVSGVRVTSANVVLVVCGWL